MANSASHRFGELIGNFFEHCMKSPVQSLAQKYNLYFDNVGQRAARKTKTVTWTDLYGSKHDLDYVIEKDGSDVQVGVPIAFIEVAWRRYTKHSKNKAQEITAAVEPIVAKYREVNPFKGAIICGEFTETSIEQLKGRGFAVLYIPYSEMVQCFKKYGVDLSYDESTEENEFASKIEQFEKADKLALKNELLKHNSSVINNFMITLENVIRRTIKSIYILPLHGKASILNSIESAIGFIDSYKTMPPDATFQSYVIQIYFNDGSEIKAELKDNDMAKSFLMKMNLLLTS